MQFASSEAVIDNLYHDITFQVWRPIQIDSELLYSFVGSQTIDFIAGGLRENLIVMNGTQYINFTSAQPHPDKRLIFQPGDVIGWYIHTFVQSTKVPLTVVYRSSNNETTGLQPLNMYTTLITDTKRAATEPPCRLSLLTNRTTLIPSVIPYVTVDYIYGESELTHAPIHFEITGCPFHFLCCCQL